MEAWTAYRDENRSQFLADLLEFLRIPSVSAEPAHAVDVERAAQWVADRLRKAPVEHVAILPTGGHPAVYGDWLHAPGRPTVLVYGHFDVQPADAASEWTHPPFDPVVREDRVYARGATDNKGNMLVPILAVEALLRTQGHLGVNLKFFFEGQEEINSPDLPKLLASQRRLLACDFVLNADANQWAEDQPALFVSSRGLCSLQVDVQGPAFDLHSGLYGGTVPNPIHTLVDLLHALHAPDGSVQVAGFYDGVPPLSAEERRLIARIPFSETAYRQQAGVAGLTGESGYSTLERAWVRPTLEVNGIWGGFQGDGMKTIVPSRAHAKLSCRLVPDQDPARIAALITEHLQQRAPSSASVQVVTLAGAADPYRIPLDHPGIRAAHQVLASLYDKEPYYARSGASLPVCNLFLQELGAHSVIFGFGLADERAHGPDEFFRLQSFELGQESYCRILRQLGEWERLT